MGLDLVPKLLGQAEYSLILKGMNQEGISDILHATCSKISRTHKNAIMQHMKTLDNLVLQAQKQKRD